MAQIVLSGDGVTLEIEDEIAKSDELLKRVLSPHYPDLANALISREEKDGRLKVTLSKRAGTKGNDQKLNRARSQNVVVLTLDAAPDYLNPALALAWQLCHQASSSNTSSGEEGLTLQTQLALQGVIRQAIEQGEAEAAQVGKAVEQLNAAPPVPSLHLPRGF